VPRDGRDEEDDILIAAAIAAMRSLYESE